MRRDTKVCHDIAEDITLYSGSFENLFCVRDYEKCKKLDTKIQSALYSFDPIISYL